MKSMALLFLLLLVTGCSHLRPDPVAIPAIEAGYPTVEILACGQRWNGLAVCSVNKGEPYSGIGLKIQTYFEGTVAIDAKNCDIDLAPPLSYENSELISVKLPELANKNCVISVTVSPKYPKEESQDIKVYSYRGHIAIRVIDDGANWEGEAYKVTGNFRAEMGVFVGTQTQVRVVASGCGRNIYDETLPSPGGHLTIPIHDIVSPNLDVETCVIEGFIRDPQYEDILFNIIVSKYDERFVPLPTPVVEIKGQDQIRIKGDEAVSIVSLNNKYEVDMEHKFEFNPAKPNVIRVLTVKARSVIGVWKANSWEWLK